ncbi:tyrosine-type recombinase/integrase [Desulfitobacterium hafniense]|uniref:tyrosine-type recombinase/integrase n=1 Tax=Desulfitobacterium hafniense TaxID=49338 RepID=UPI0013053098|nr:tyrosine-type recombinase/integrase [Desulfitobacterium hafniense]
MNEILLTELIVKAKAAIVPLGHSQSTVYQYGLAWNALNQYFEVHSQTFFLEELANQFVEQTREQLEAGTLKLWRFKLHRLATAILTEVYHTGRYEWQFHHADPNDYLHAEHRRIYEAFQRDLEKAGKGNGTRSLYGTVSRQFFSCLQNELHELVPHLQLDDVRTIMVSISRSYQKTSMRTVLSALRVFLSFLWKTGETTINLTAAVPSSGSRKVAVVPTLTAEEETQLLQSIDRSTCLGKRNYAMLLLAVRTGLRTVDIINLKLPDMDWRANSINIIQQKNRRPLSLPILPDVGNALVGYILHARPESSNPYLFLKTVPPFVKLTDCYHVSRRALEKAELRQDDSQSKGFHIFRHSNI